MPVIVLGPPGGGPDLDSTPLRLISSSLSSSSGDLYLCIKPSYTRSPILWGRTCAVTQFRGAMMSLYDLLIPRPEVLSDDGIESIVDLANVGGRRKRRPPYRTSVSCWYSTHLYSHVIPARSVKCYGRNDEATWGLSELGCLKTLFFGGIFCPVFGSADIIYSVYFYWS